MSEDAHEMTLDPPGRIAIIGAGPLGLEAALYGRFLGYDVTVLERGEVGQSLREYRDQPLPMLPSACLSPLAWSAISAQRGSGDTMPAAALPLTIGQWLAEGLETLAKTDLLRGRVLSGHEVRAIELVEAATTEDHADALDHADEALAAQESDDYIDGEVPADFRLSVSRPEHASGPSERSISDSGNIEMFDCEAVILAIGDADARLIAGIESCQDSPYFFRLPDLAGDGSTLDRSAEHGLRAGWRDIVRIFARLGGRKEQDLYRPIRL